MPNEKNIKDYLHLYLGCEVLIEKCSYHFVHDLMINAGDIKKMSIRLLKDILIGSGVVAKPLLTPLSKMTKKENKELAEIIGLDTDKETHIWTPEQFLWLLAHHFDLFGLIEAGLAIDKNKIS